MGVACAQLLPSDMRNGVTSVKACFAPPLVLGHQHFASLFCRLLKIHSLSRAQAGSAFSEEFLIYYFKVTPCNRKYPHDWASCLCGHKGERANRRDLRTHNYLPIACEFAKQKLECPLGDACPHSHNLFEYWLHPQRYKTEMCLFRANCDRPVCFFAHSAEELRPLDPSLPPAEICWSAGAALPGKEASSSGSSSRRAPRHTPGGQAAALGANKQQQHQQQEQHIQQLQQQFLLSQGHHIGARQQQVSGNIPASQQQSMLVKMASGELAVLAPVQQPLQQQQHVVLDSSRQGMAGGLQSPAQTSSHGLASNQVHPPAVSMGTAVPLMVGAAPTNMLPTLLGPLIPTSAAAAAAATPAIAGSWPQQLMVDPLQLQLHQQQRQQPLQQQQQQLLCSYPSNSFSPTLHQAGISGFGSSACAPQTLLYPQSAAHLSAASGLPTPQQLIGASALGAQSAMQAAACGSPAALPAAAAAAAAQQALQLQKEGLLGLAAAGSSSSNTVVSRQYDTQLGSVLTAVSPVTSPMSAVYAAGQGSVSQGFISSQGSSSPAALGLGADGDLGGLLTALQNMHIHTPVTRA